MNTGQQFERGLGRKMSANLPTDYLNLAGNQLDQPDLVNMLPHCRGRMMNISRLAATWLLVLCASIASEACARSSQWLALQGIKLGQVLDYQLAHKEFSGLTCKRDRGAPRFDHRLVTLCTGTTTFERQIMHGLIFLDRNNRVVSIFLHYDIPGRNYKLDTASVGEMEKRLIATYGMPDILRTESSYQRKAYSPADLGVGDTGRSAVDVGSDQWAFARGASIVLGEGGDHRDEPGGPVIDGESISFESEPVLTGMELPARHRIPVVLTKIFRASGNASPWSAGEQVDVLLAPGGARTCTMAQAVPLRPTSRQRNFITCTEFVPIAASAVQAPPKTKITISKGGRKFAIGYIVGPIRK